MRHKQRRFAALSAQERLLLLHAGALWLCVAAGRRILGFRRLQTLLARVLPLANPTTELGETSLEVAQRTARMVRIASHNGLVRANCLEQSLMLWGLLRRRGIRGDTRIGVRKNGGQFEAHAWVEYEGVALNDTADVGERFATFPTPAGRIPQ